MRADECDQIGDGYAQLAWAAQIVGLERLAHRLGERASWWHIEADAGRWMSKLHLDPFVIASAVNTLAWMWKAS